MPIVNDLHKRAVKATAARLKIHQGLHPILVGNSVARAAKSFGLQVGDMSRASAIAGYASACTGKRTNRQWQGYGEFQALVGKLSKQAMVEVDIMLQ